MSQGSGKNSYWRSRHAIRLVLVSFRPRIKLWFLLRPRARVAFSTAGVLFVLDSRDIIGRLSGRDSDGLGGGVVPAGFHGKSLDGDRLNPGVDWT